MLVSAFAGYDTIRAAYAHAVAQGYRFFSYGDAVLLEPLRAGAVAAAFQRIPPPHTGGGFAGPAA